jgi:ABC-type multidrug transport system fused ATPase/permease subunit
MYPGSKRWAVRHLSFTLRAGEVVALVGENGAGKTTLVKLLTRLYDPDEGRILLDGHDLREYDLDGLRGNMGVIFQNFVRYNLSAADNIAVGRIGARNDRARIERAATRSQADEVIARRPACGGRLPPYDALPRSPRVYRSLGFYLWFRCTQFAGPLNLLKRHPPWSARDVTRVRPTLPERP